MRLARMLKPIRRNHSLSKTWMLQNQKNHSLKTKMKLSQTLQSLQRSLQIKRQLRNLQTIKSHRSRKNSLSSHLIKLEKMRSSLTHQQILSVKLTLRQKMTTSHRLLITQITTTWIIYQIMSI